MFANEINNRPKHKVDVYSYIALSEPNETDRFLREKGYPIAQNDGQRIGMLTNFANKEREKGLYEIAQRLHPDKELIIEAEKQLSEKYKNACGCSALLLGADGEQSKMKNATGNENTTIETPRTENKRYDLIETVAIVLVSFLVIGGTVTMLRNK